MKSFKQYLEAKSMYSPTTQSVFSGASSGVPTGESLDLNVIKQILKNAHPHQAQHIDKFDANGFKYLMTTYNSNYHHPLTISNNTVSGDKESINYFKQLLGTSRGLTLAIGNYWDNE